MHLILALLNYVPLYRVQKYVGGSISVHQESILWASSLDVQRRHQCSVIVSSPNEYMDWIDHTKVEPQKARDGIVIALYQEHVGTIRQAALLSRFSLLAVRSHTVKMILDCGTSMAIEQEI